jgi:hypothetical protein
MVQGRIQRITTYCKIRVLHSKYSTALYSMYYDVINSTLSSLSRCYACAFRVSGASSMYVDDVLEDNGTEKGVDFDRFPMVSLDSS